MEKQLMNVTEVAMVVGISVQTIASWYRWKALHPEHELAALLPDYQQLGNKKTRYWASEDLWKLVEFKNKRPQGRYGIMGEITQKYIKSNFRNRQED